MYGIEGGFIMEMRITDNEDVSLLRAMGIDVFPQNRSYWFIRTQKGSYYEDFINLRFVGIEWDKVSDKEFIENASEEDLKIEVATQYPGIDKPGYAAGQISKFTKGIRKGDIILIPNEHSEWISFGEVVDDEIYLYEEDDDDFQTILDDFYDTPQEGKEKSVLKKRRRVEWLKQVKRIDLDPYLYGIIYAHNAVVDANRYSLFIDRTLSQFYIKGDEAYLTYKVNKKKNIPYCDLVNFLNNNSALIDYINKYCPELKINHEELVLKINVQSRGPVQLKGAVRDVLIIGLVIGAIFGTKMNFKIIGLEYSVDTKGLPGLITSINEMIDSKKESEQEKDLQRIVDNLLEDKRKLQLQLPQEGDEHGLQHSSNNENAVGEVILEEESTTNNK